MSQRTPSAKCGGTCQPTSSRASGSP
jgi:hypothetical protein